MFVEIIRVTQVRLICHAHWKETAIIDSSMHRLLQLMRNLAFLILLGIFNVACQSLQADLSPQKVSG